MDGEGSHIIHEKSVIMSYFRSMKQHFRRNTHSQKHMKGTACVFGVNNSLCSCTVWVHISVIHTVVFPLPHIHFPLSAPHEQEHSELSVVRLFKSTLTAVNSAIMYAFLFTGCGCTVVVQKSAKGMGSNAPIQSFLFHVLL